MITIFAHFKVKLRLLINETWKLELVYCYYAGLAIKDFWQVDDRTIVFVADPTFGK
jgi:hypothetical protein